jgi:hypothetical protein
MDIPSSTFGIEFAPSRAEAGCSALYSARTKRLENSKFDGVSVVFVWSRANPGLPAHPFALPKIPIVRASRIHQHVLVQLALGVAVLAQAWYHNIALMRKLKDFDFLMTGPDTLERDLERALIDH